MNCSMRCSSLSPSSALNFNALRTRVEARVREVSALSLAWLCLGGLGVKVTCWSFRSSSIWPHKISTKYTGQILQYLLISLGTPSNSHLYCAVSSCLAAVSRVILFLALFACRSDRRPLLHQFNNCTLNRYLPARNIYSHVFHLHNWLQTSLRPS